MLLLVVKPSEQDMWRIIAQIVLDSLKGESNNKH